jgi:hypothetical protein
MNISKRQKKNSKNLRYRSALNFVNRRFDEIIDNLANRMIDDICRIYGVERT